MWVIRTSVFVCVLWCVIVWVAVYFCVGCGVFLCELWCYCVGCSVFLCGLWCVVWDDKFQCVGSGLLLCGLRWFLCGSNHLRKTSAMRQNLHDSFSLSLMQ